MLTGIKRAGAGRVVLPSEMPSAGRALATPCRSGGSREPFLLIGWIKSSRLPPLLHGPGGHGFRLEGSCFRAPTAAAPAPPALPVGPGRPAPAPAGRPAAGRLPGNALASGAPFPVPKSEEGPVRKKFD